MEVHLANHNTNKSSQGQETFYGQPTPGMKKCPFCAELIQAEAIKCRYCGEFLDGSTRASVKPKGKKWYFSTPTVVFSLLCLGPLALPLVWLNPHYKPLTRLLISLLVLIVTFLCLYVMIDAYEEIFKQIDALGM